MRHRVTYASGPLIVPAFALEAFVVNSVPCQLCHQPVSLENARINEHGKAVHEECYLSALKIVPAPKQNPTEPGTVA
jgi:hypothetical protein